MQPMPSVMRSVVRCLATTIVSLVMAIPALSQEPEYIIGTGVTRREAIDHLYVNVLDYCGYQVSSHTSVKNDNGEYDYGSVTAVDRGANVPREGLELIPQDGYWIARIEVSKIREQEVKWVEQNVTINETYNETPYYSRGFRRENSTTVTTRRTDIVGPSGRVVSSTPGRGSVKNTRRRWNGRYGYTLEHTTTDR